MITYEQAVEKADAREALLVSHSGGRKRYARFLPKDQGGVVCVRLFGTTIAAFTPEGVAVLTGGYNTATTVEALNALVGPGTFGTVKGVLYVHPWDGAARRKPFTENMMLDYAGRVIREGFEAPPTRPGRKTRREGAAGYTVQPS